MNQYVTGAVIRQLREKARMTQAELAQRLFVSDKAVSKWESGKGCPDVSLWEPLAKALGVSIHELLAGRPVRNANTAGNMMRSVFYLCPECGNVVHSTGEAVVSCLKSDSPVIVAASDDAEDILRALTEEADQLWMPVPDGAEGQAALLEELIAEAALRL